MAIEIMLRILAGTFGDLKLITEIIFFIVVTQDNLYFFRAPVE